MQRYSDPVRTLESEFKEQYPFVEDFFYHRTYMTWVANCHGNVTVSDPQLLVVLNRLQQLKNPQPNDPARQT